MGTPYTTIRGDQHVSLREIDPGKTGSLTEQQADAQLKEIRQELRELHDLMMAAGSQALLLILEGMDASGKDVTIENVHAAFNPQMARVTSFSKPKGEEAQHHFLWRMDVATPAFGEVTTFDRSPYEQALPEELEGEVSGEERKRRLEHINAFERLLTDEGTIVIKVFLHVGKETQAKRLEERQNDIQMAWKISEDDWIKRDQWDTYMAAFEELMNSCATPDTPWYIVPADHRWYHNAVIAQILVERLRPFREAWEAKRRQIGKQNQKKAREAQSNAS